MNIYLQLLLGRQLYSRQARFIGNLCLLQDDRNGKVGIGWQFGLHILSSLPYIHIQTK